MYFGMKNYLKNNRNHTSNTLKNQNREHLLTCVVCGDLEDGIQPNYGVELS